MRASLEHSIPPPHFLKKRQHSMFEATRVTRYGEFSTIGWLFTLGSFLKMTEVAQNHGPHYTNVPVMYLF
jgi:hypothetical protein